MTTIDLASYDSKEELATDLRDLVKESSDAIGQDADLEVTLKEEDGSFYLYWDGGPWNWAVDLVGGENILGTVLTGLTTRSSVYVEAQTKHALVIGEY